MAALYRMSKHIISGHLNLSPEDFLPASKEEKESLVVMRQSVSFWQDGFRRLLKNKVALASLAVFFVILILAFIVPIFYPYNYAIQLKGSERLMPMQYSAGELARIAAGEKVFLLASFIVLINGSIYGSVAAFTGGWVDLIMMRIVDVIYTVPDILLIILLTFALKKPMKLLASAPGFGWINVLGINLISIFIVFALLYWVGMARIVRGQILVLKEQEYVTAARALGAKSGQIIRKHLLTNTIGTLIVTTTLQIPSAIFTESYLSFLGLGVAVPMPSLGSLASDAITGLQSYPHLLFAPAILISLIILSLNLLGDGLRDAFDPKLKN